MHSGCSPPWLVSKFCTPPRPSVKSPACEAFPSESSCNCFSASTLGAVLGESLPISQEERHCGYSMGSSPSSTPMWLQLSWFFSELHSGCLICMVEYEYLFYEVMVKGKGVSRCKLFSTLPGTG